MTISVSSNIVTSIENLLTVEGEHTTKNNLIIRDLRNRISHMNLCSKLIFLNMCSSRRIGPKEIMSIAKRTFAR